MECRVFACLLAGALVVSACTKSTPPENSPGRIQPSESPDSESEELENEESSPPPPRVDEEDETATAELRPVAHPLVGVRIDGIASLDSTLSSLKQLAKRPTTRLAFEPHVSAAHYLAAVEQLHAVGWVFGQLLDSYELKEYSRASYKSRAREYLKLLGDLVDVWEVGNEINAPWLDADPSVIKKVSSVFDIVEGQGKRSALTLYHDACKQNSEQKLLAAARRLPARMREGLNYVLISHYDDECSGRPQWSALFTQLGKIFPASYLAIGEIGTVYSERKSAQISSYYALRLKNPRFVGGYFWRYFEQDMVPMTRPLWTVLNSSLK
jgi:hypothetical protein